MSWGYYQPYVSVAEKRRRAEKEAAKLAKKSGGVLSPVCIEGRKIASTFWGKAWCDNLESYSDYAYRLPRGRSYVRNGCVIDLKISECAIDAMVSGSKLYKVKIRIKPVRREIWNDLKEESAGQIGSLIDLLQGKLSRAVMEIMTRKGDGLFPAPSEIDLRCSCPDSASMCKHVAAVLYGVGARLDEHPELLFVLRDVDQKELITQAAGSIAATPESAAKSEEILEDDNLASVFGIDLDGGAEIETSKVAETAPVKTAGRKKAKPAAGKRVEKVVKKAAKKTASKATTPRKPAAKAAKTRRAT
ncbi:MAG: hypothetical protein EOP84_22210 [Verrucomicrobiaceae bacterium]|nr:MAG: hypothetical protein EOP84_22210 [Verrucomicrobiaceae bacterium]